MKNEDIEDYIGIIVSSAFFIILIKNFQVLKINIGGILYKNISLARKVHSKCADNFIRTNL